MVQNLGLSKRYKIRAEQARPIQDTRYRNGSRRKAFYISCIFVSCNLYLTDKPQFQTILSKLNTSSNSSAVRYPNRTQASFRVIPSPWASLATLAAFS